MTLIVKKALINGADNLVLLCDRSLRLQSSGLSSEEIGFVKSRISDHEKKTIYLRTATRCIVVQIIDKDEKSKVLEGLRKAASQVGIWLNEQSCTDVVIVDVAGKPAETLAFAEGLALGNYQFLKYKKTKDKEANSLSTIFISGKNLSSSAIDELNILINSVFRTRDLVNEPANVLTATQLSKEFQKLGKEAGFSVEVFNKAKITSLKMGGLLAVNLGSVDPPTFTIMEYKPARARNKKPVVLVGKGVVYDTGGLSLKPTPNSMDMMKCDMAGAATVAGAIYAVAKAKLPVHIIAIVPATDNRPGGNAYVPGDIITMYNGLTVEMLNADAEGRMILGDALAYAKKYDPELVLDFATLTGAAVAAIGSSGIVAMGTAPQRTMQKMKVSGDLTFERIAEMPFWDDYDELIKSDIADMKNVGGPYAGAITAGRFLAKFVSYPWMHFDIAGPAFLTGRDGYRIKGGTGVGVRLLFNYFRNNY